MGQDDGRSLSGRATPAEPVVSALREGIANANIPSIKQVQNLAERMRELGEFISNVEADIPEPTCSSIDLVLRDIAEPRRKADKLVRDKPDNRELEEFADEVDAALWGLPDSLEQLRHDNCQLRDGVHYLGSYCHEAGRLLLEAVQAVEDVLSAPDDIAQLRKEIESE